MMSFEKVVAVIGWRWREVSAAANDATGRILFAAESQDVEAENEIKSEVCDGVLYVVYAQRHVNEVTQLMLEDRGLLRGGFQEESKRELENMKRLLFLFLVSHVVIWVQNGPALPSTRVWNVMSLLKSAKARFASSNKSKAKRGMPGNSQPWFAFGFLSEIDVSKVQNTLGTLLKVYNITGRNGLVRSTNALCCGTIGEFGVLRRELLPKTTIEPFEMQDWMDAAQNLRAVLKIGRCITGLLSLVERASNRAAERNSKKDNSAIQRFESVLKNEDQITKAICDKGFPHAIELYSRGLPAQYNLERHELNVQAALKEFRRFASAKGGWSRRMEKKIVDHCNKLFTGEVGSASKRILDRRLCDATSLRGIPCKELFRSCVRYDSAVSEGTLDLEKCSTGLTLRLGCSCGRSLIESPDPFLPQQLKHWSSCCEENKESSQVLDCTNDLNAFRNFDEKSRPVSIQTTSGIIRNSQNDDPSKKPNSWILHRIKGWKYNHDEGLAYDGLFQGYNRLEPWGETGIYVGVEFECSANGTRQILPSSKLATLSPFSNDSTEELTFPVWPNYDVELFLDANSPTKTQLQRIYIATPAQGFFNLDPSWPEGLSKLRLKAFIQFEDEEWSCFTHEEVELEPDSFYTLSLPHFFFKQTEMSKIPSEPLTCKAHIESHLLSFGGATEK